MCNDLKTTLGKHSAINSIDVIQMSIVNLEYT